MGQKLVHPWLRVPQTERCCSAKKHCNTLIKYGPGVEKSTKTFVDRLGAFNCVYHASTYSHQQIERNEVQRGLDSVVTDIHLFQ
jgi:hypothetical protein